MSRARHPRSWRKPRGPIAALVAELGDIRHETRLHAVEALTALGPAASPALPALIDVFGDGYTTSSTSSFGPTGYDPAVDFPIALGALRAVVAIGPLAAAPLLDALRTLRNDAKLYYIALALGELGVADAIPALEEMARARDSVSVRHSFDQWNDYPLYEAAQTALRRLGRSHPHD